MSKIKNKLREIIKNSDEVFKDLIQYLKDEKVQIDEGFDLSSIVDQISRDSLDKITEKTRGDDYLSALVLLGLIRVYADTLSLAIDPAIEIDDNTNSVEEYPDIYL